MPPAPPSTYPQLSVSMHFADHLPFHRMAGILLREGLTIDRSTLARVAARVSDALRLVVDRMGRELLGSDAVLGIDGTNVKVLARPHCARRTVYVRHGAGHVVYLALRAADAARVLEGSGRVQDPARGQNTVTSTAR